MEIFRCLKCDKELQFSESPIAVIKKIKWFCDDCKRPTCKRCGIILGDWICPACYDTHGVVYEEDPSICLRCSDSKKIWGGNDDE